MLSAISMMIAVCIEGIKQASLVLVYSCACDYITLVNFSCQVLVKPVSDSQQDLSCSQLLN
jgi:hypothetical protein